VPGRATDAVLLRHATELASASALLQHSSRGKLHVVLSPARAPSLPSPLPQTWPGAQQLARAIEAARGKPSEDEPLVVPAYRALAAWLSCPDSAQLASWLTRLRGTALTGEAFEPDAEAAKSLERDWHGTGVSIHTRAWQEHRPQLASPGASPWLLSMDIGGEQLDLDRFVQRAAPLVADLLSSGAPGIAALFAPKLKQQEQERFAQAAWNMTAGLSPRPSQGFLRARAGTSRARHMAVVLPTSLELAQVVGREVSRCLELDNRGYLGVPDLFVAPRSPRKGPKQG
jgi:hypothetical protein